MHEAQPSVSWKNPTSSSTHTKAPMWSTKSHSKDHRKSISVGGIPSGQTTSSVLYFSFVSSDLKNQGRKQVAPYPHGETQPHKALEPQEAIDSGALVNNLAQERG
ncbi:hypothetical protein Pyn_12868 [Prunus yedoensis var. nudiflora]|uniref:Uncharacterized protein n=1 Tax=Prunus yedoensis var. nudiflora TaxID=2094558 RepID=A0A314YQP4_PRUYE|nr:hypothetical protein Pyn_12868 [Prunus yedoensis var. nudiflora]